MMPHKSSTPLAPDYLALSWAGTRRHLQADLQDFVSVLRARLLADLEQRRYDNEARAIAQQLRVDRATFRAAVLQVLDEQYGEPATKKAHRRKGLHHDATRRS